MKAIQSLRKIILITAYPQILWIQLSEKVTVVLKKIWRDKAGLGLRDDEMRPLFHC